MINGFIVLWVAIGLFFFVVELIHPGLFYFLSVALGSLQAAFAAYFAFSTLSQSIVFVISSIISFYLLKSWAKRISAKQHASFNVYSLQGKQGILISPATQTQFGYVYVNSQVWACKSIDNIVIDAGVMVQIVSMKGAHLIVSKLDVEVK